MTTFEIVSEVANAESLKFLVIGGHAVNAYGFTRYTEDLDILVEKQASLRWLTALAAKGLNLYHDGGAFLQMKPSSDRDPLDLMLVEADTFNKLADGYTETKVSGITMRVPSLENLFALKFHVLRQDLPRRGFKDFIDIIALADENNVDLRSDKIRNLCEQFGTKKIYERILAFKS